MLWRKFATELIVSELLIIFVFIIWLWRISGGYSKEMMVVLGHESFPVRRDIRTLVANIALHFLGCSAGPVYAHRKELFNQFSGQIIINSDDYCSVLSN